MLRNTGDDGDVVLGVAGVQERVESTSPRGYLARESENGKTSADDTSDGDCNALEKIVEVLLRHVGLKVVDESEDLTEPKDPKSQHVFTRLNRLETDEADLHGQKGAEGVDCAISDVDLVAEPSSHH